MASAEFTYPPCLEFLTAQRKVQMKNIGRKTREYKVRRESVGGNPFDDFSPEERV